MNNDRTIDSDYSNNSQKLKKVINVVIVLQLLLAFWKIYQVYHSVSLLIFVQNDLKNTHSADFKWFTFWDYLKFSLDFIVQAFLFLAGSFLLYKKRKIGWIFCFVGSVFGAIIISKGLYFEIFGHESIIFSRNYIRIYSTLINFLVLSLQIFTVVLLAESLLLNKFNIRIKDWLISAIAILLLYFFV